MKVVYEKKQKSKLVTYNQIKHRVLYEVVESDFSEWVGSVVFRPDSYSNGKLVIILNTVTKNVTANPVSPFGDTYENSGTKYRELTNVELTIKEKD